MPDSWLSRTAPTTPEVGYGVALFGTAILAGTPYAELHAMREAARGAALPPAQDITVGALVGGSGSLCGHVAQVRLRSRRLTAGEARTCAANLRAPADFVRLVD